LPAGVPVVSNAAVENFLLRPVSQFPGSFEHEHEDDLVRTSA